MKTCNTCNEKKELSEFLMYTTKVGDKCKNCIKAYQKAYREKNKAKIAKQKKERYTDKREDILEQKKKYYGENAASIKDKKKEYRKDNADAIAVKQAEYYRENKESLREYQRKKRSTPEYKVKMRQYSYSRRARISNDDDHTITKEYLSTLLEKQRYCCFYCSNELPAKGYELDHYIPIAKGGAHSIGNVVWSCRTCNRSKNAKIPEEPLTFVIPIRKENDD